MHPKPLSLLCMLKSIIKPLRPSWNGVSDGSNEEQKKKTQKTFYFYFNFPVTAGSQSWMSMMDEHLVLILWITRTYRIVLKMIVIILDPWAKSAVQQLSTEATLAPMVLLARSSPWANFKSFSTAGLSLWTTFLLQWRAQQQQDEHPARIHGSVHQVWDLYLKKEREANRKREKKELARQFLFKYI